MCKHQYHSWLRDMTFVCFLCVFSGGKAWQKSHYGQGSGSIWLDDVDCTGDEDDVFLCQHRGWGIGNCGHNEDAGVSCQASTSEYLHTIYNLILSKAHYF